MAFFILIVVLMLDLVFGIIIETFKELRIEEQKAEYDRQFKCFICNIDKDDLEKQREDFTEHNLKKHNMWNYVNYMIRLKYSFKQDLNAINSYSLELIEKKQTKWIPSKNGSKKEEGGGEEPTEEEDDIEVDKYDDHHHELQINKNRE